MLHWVRVRPASIYMTIGGRWTDEVEVMCVRELYNYHVIWFSVRYNPGGLLVYELYTNSSATLGLVSNFLYSSTPRIQLSQFLPRRVACVSFSPYLVYTFTANDTICFILTSIFCVFGSLLHCALSPHTLCHELSQFY